MTAPGSLLLRRLVDPKELLRRLGASPAARGWGFFNQTWQKLENEESTCPAAWESEPWLRFSSPKPPLSRPLHPRPPHSRFRPAASLFPGRKTGLWLSLFTAPQVPHTAVAWQPPRKNVTLAWGPAPDKSPFGARPASSG